MTFDLRRVCVRAWGGVRERVEVQAARSTFVGLELVSGQGCALAPARLGSHLILVDVVEDTDIDLNDLAVGA